MTTRRPMIRKLRALRRLWHFALFMEDVDARAVYRPLGSFDFDVAPHQNPQGWEPGPAARFHRRVSG